MQNTSATYRHIISSLNYWFETKVTINGVDYGEDQIFSLSTHTAMFDSDPEVGHAIAAEIDLKIIKPTVDIPRMAEVIPWVRVCTEEEVPSPVSLDGDILDFGSDGTMENDVIVLQNAYLAKDIVYFQSSYQRLESEWIQKGAFYIDTREITKNSNGLEIMEIHGYDAMLRADQDYAVSDREWPAEDTDVVRDIAAAMNVQIDERTWDEMTDGNMFEIPSNLTLRETLGYIASMYVGSFVMTDQGKLRLVTLTELPKETNYLIDDIGFAITFGGDRIKV